MALVLARVDSRLVHGQILEGWVPRLRIDAILVVDPRLVGDPLQRDLLQGLSHPGLEVRLEGPVSAARLLAGQWARRRAMVLFSGVEGAVEAFEAGVGFSALNLGNLHPRVGSRPVTASAFLTREDAAALSGLRARGVALEARAVPSDRSPDVSAWLEAVGREG